MTRRQKPNELKRLARQSPIRELAEKMAKYNQECKSAGRCRGRINPGKQSVGQRQLRVIRDMRYYLEVREQVQRHRTGQDRKSVHGLGTCVWAHKWLSQTATNTTSTAQTETEDSRLSQHRALWFTDRHVDGGQS